MGRGAAGGASLVAGAAAMDGRASGYLKGMCEREGKKGQNPSKQRASDRNKKPGAGNGQAKGRF